MLNNCSSTKGISFISAVIPRTARILKILDPIRLPTAKLSSFFRAAIMVVASSGMLVPMAITVTAITLSETLNTFAKVIAPSTK